MEVRDVFAQESFRQIKFLEHNTGAFLLIPNLLRTKHLFISDILQESLNVFVRSEQRIVEQRIPRKVEVFNFSHQPHELYQTVLILYLRVVVR